MIKPLRNTHRHVWSLAAIVLPVMIVLSWLVIPNPVPVKFVSVQQKLLPQVISKKETAQYCLNIRTGKEKGIWQLEWKNKLPLTTPSAVLYQTVDNQKRFIGRIEARGDYVFHITGSEDDTLHLLVYDFIHEQIIDSINLKIL